MKNTKVRNQLELWLFCAIIGAFAGGLVWALLKVLAIGTEVIWEWIPGRFSIPFYTIVVCTIGAAIIGPDGSILTLQSLQAVSQSEIDQGATYLSKMQENYSVLEKALNEGSRETWHN